MEIRLRDAGGRMYDRDDRDRSQNTDAVEELLDFPDPEEVMGKGKFRKDSPLVAASYDVYKLEKKREKIADRLEERGHPEEVLAALEEAHAAYTDALHEAKSRFLEEHEGGEMNATYAVVRNVYREALNILTEEERALLDYDGIGEDGTAADMPTGPDKDVIREMTVRDEDVVVYPTAAARRRTDSPHIQGTYEPEPPASDYRPESDAWLDEALETRSIQELYEEMEKDVH